MKEINYVIWKEDKHYIAQCLNVDVSSFGDTIDEAIASIKEAVELYFENDIKDFVKIDKLFLGKDYINA
ncbi:MAG: type II toxin-antitoxin system HicB family antitoxin [Ignavibacteria bacterium]|jgi:predicted RNase H-like HicB family nuclease